MGILLLALINSSSNSNMKSANVKVNEKQKKTFFVHIFV